MKRSIQIFSALALVSAMGGVQAKALGFDLGKMNVTLPQVVIGTSNLFDVVLHFGSDGRFSVVSYAANPTGAAPAAADALVFDLGKMSLTVPEISLNGSSLYNIALRFDADGRFSVSAYSATAPATPTPAPNPTPTGATSECTPLAPKAGDALAYVFANTSAGMATSFAMNYDYSNGTYAANKAIVLTASTTLAGKTTSAISYLDPATGAVVGNGGSTDTTTTTTFDPVDYESRLRSAVTTVGQKATVNVKARVSGAGITSAFSAIGGGTALNMNYTYSVERLPNDTVTVGSASYNTCKLQVNMAVNNVTLEGGNPSNPLYGQMFDLLSATYKAPSSSNIWLSSQLPGIVKATSQITIPSVGTASTTQTLTSALLAPR